LCLGGALSITPTSITAASGMLCTTGTPTIKVVDMSSNGYSDVKIEVKDDRGNIICTGSWCNLRANQFWSLVRWCKQLGINVDYSTCDPNFLPFRKGGKI